MSSAIDADKPEDGVPASKADLRDNLLVAKTELDHGGFAVGFTPSNYGPPPTTKVADHLAAIDGALADKSGVFTELADAPGSYGTQANKFVKVRSDETGLEFVASGGATIADAVDYHPPLTGIVTRSVEKSTS